MRRDVTIAMENSQWQEAKKLIRKLLPKADALEKERLELLLRRADGEIAWEKASRDLDKAPSYRAKREIVDRFLASHGETAELRTRAEARLKELVESYCLTLEDFEGEELPDDDLSAVDDPKLVKQGRRAARFRSDDRLDEQSVYIYSEEESTDWTPYSTLVLWIFAEKSGGRLTIDALTDHDNYFEVWNNIDWTGWKELRLPLEEKGCRFSKEGKPEWSEIGSVRFWKQRGGTIDIVLDDIHLEKE